MYSPFQKSPFTCPIKLNFIVWSTYQIRRRQETRLIWITNRMSITFWDDPERGSCVKLAFFGKWFNISIRSKRNVDAACNNHSQCGWSCRKALMDSPTEKLGFVVRHRTKNIASLSFYIHVTACMSYDILVASVSGNCISALYWDYIYLPDFFFNKDPKAFQEDPWSPNHRNSLSTQIDKKVKVYSFLGARMYIFDCISGSIDNSSQITIHQENAGHICIRIVVFFLRNDVWHCRMR